MERNLPVKLNRACKMTMKMCGWDDDDIECWTRCYRVQKQNRIREVYIYTYIHDNSAHMTSISFHVTDYYTSTYTKHKRAGPCIWYYNTQRIYGKTHAHKRWSCLSQVLIFAFQSCDHARACWVNECDVFKVLPQHLPSCLAHLRTKCDDAGTPPKR